MIKTLFATVAASAITGAASADVTFNFSGLEGSGQSQSVTSPALYGTLTGVVFHFLYHASGSPDEMDSWASDIAAVVGSSQWGGDYTMLALGASTYEGGTGAPDSPAVLIFTSSQLSLATNVPFNGETTLVGWANTYISRGGASVGNVSITLVGVNLTPTPGAAAVLGLGGLMGGRRRRR
ncbi:MAG: hypothetical protein QM783_19455 [Phycisphaerales bacterium]